MRSFAFRPLPTLSRPTRYSSRPPLVERTAMRRAIAARKKENSFDIVARRHSLTGATRRGRATRYHKRLHYSFYFKDNLINKIK